MQRPDNWLSCLIDSLIPHHWWEQLILSYIMTVPFAANMGGPIGGPIVVWLLTIGTALVLVIGAVVNLYCWVKDWWDWR